jgi:Nucleoplasmin-like domain
MLISLRRSTVVKPDQPVSVIPQGDLVITNAALGTQLADTIGRTSVKLTYTRPVKVTSDDEDEEEEDDQDAQVETVLCSFTPGNIEQCTLNLTFEEDDEFLLEVVGKKYASLRLLIAVFHLLSARLVKSIFLVTTSVRHASSTLEIARGLG